MNLSEERNYQKLADTLDELGLSEANRQLAEEYFDPAAEERPELLQKVTRQDFSALPKEKQAKSISYVEHLKKRARTEDLARYVRFAAAAGGSTASYLLTEYSWNMKDIREYLTPEQAAAIQAETLVWNRYALSWNGIRELTDAARRDRWTIRRAMDLCCNRYDNAKVLLAAVYLHDKKVIREGKNPLEKVFGGGVFGKSSDGDSVVRFLVDNLADSLPGMFEPSNLSEEEKSALRAYVKRGEPYGIFPEELARMMQGRNAAPYLLTLLAGSAFLAQSHSPAFLSFLQVAAALDGPGTLNACRSMSENEWFQGHLPLLERILPIGPDVFVRWYLSGQIAGGLKRMARKYPESIKTQAENASSEEYVFLMKQVEAADPALYNQMKADYSGSYQMKVAEELTNDMKNGRAEAKRYLLGEASLDELYPYVYSWRGEYGYYMRNSQQIQSMEGDGGRLYRRAIVLEALKARGGFFVYSYLPHGKKVSREEMENRTEELVSLLEQEQLPIQYQADALEGIYSGYYFEGDQNLFMDAAVKSLSRRLDTRREEFYTALEHSTAIGRMICLRVLDEDARTEKERILAAAQDSSKQVRETAALICAGHREWETEIRALLQSKKSQDRELAIRVMVKWGAEPYREELTKALETEKSKKLKELLRESLGVAAGEEEAAAGGQTPQELAAQVLKGGKKRKVAWACETSLGQVHKKDGSLADDEYLQAVLVAYADMTIPGLSPEAKQLAAQLDEKELARYVAALFDRWLESGAEAKKKWVLYAASIHGGEDIVPAFRRQIEAWPQNARGAMAAEAVKALALNGSSEALLTVDQISRKFKFRQVKAAASQALEYAAAALGISREELEDRIVPSLGFDERMERRFDYGTRKFCVYLTPALELEVLDEEGKRLKNMPAPGKRDDEAKAAESYSQFKQLKKQLKTVAANQKLRLSQALTAERLWNTQQWTDLFVKNPVMHQFAIGLIWGIYEKGSLKETFRYMEDGSFNTVDEEEFQLPEDGMVGLVHPVELTSQELAAWKEQLSDYEVTQPIEQLDRPVYRVSEEEKGTGELTRFGGKVLNGLSLSGKLQGMGWYRGSVQDAGVYYTFYREDGPVGAELEFSGCYVGDENEEVTVYGAAFYKAGTVERGSYVYDTIKKENRYCLDQVSYRYFSEIVLQLTRATASSEEQLPYPACRQ